MDTVHFSEVIEDGNEVEEETVELQPDFSAQEVEVQEVRVVETEEVTEVVEAVAVEENAHEQQTEIADILFPGRIEGRSNLGNKGFVAFEEEKDAYERDQEEVPYPSPVLEAEVDPQDTDMSSGGSSHGHRVTHRESYEPERRFNIEVDAELMIEQDESMVVAGKDSTDGAVEGAASLQLIESDGKGALVGSVANTHLSENVSGREENDMEATDQQSPSEVVKDHALGVSYRGSGEADVMEVPALNEYEPVAQTGASASRDANKDNGTSFVVPDQKAGDSGLKGLEKSENNSVSEAGNGSENGSERPDHVSLNADIGKGAKPSEDLLKSACPANIEGTPSATRAVRIGNALAEQAASLSPSATRKSKAPDTETVSGQAHAGISSEHTMAVRQNLNLWPPDACHDQGDHSQDETDKQLHLAQLSAQDAMNTATSALAQSNMAWAQIRSQNPLQTGTAREAQIASVAATVAAAASVAKAAVEAARAIADVSIKAFMQSGAQKVDGNPSPSRSKGRKNSTSARHKNSNMLESVVKAAGMAAEAATQAGAVVALADPLMQSRGMKGPWTRKAYVMEDAAAEKRRITKGNSALKKSKSHTSASPHVTPTKISNVNVDGIAEASAVEVMTAEVGLRGGWFSGKVVRVTEVEAYVAYDEILTDDGSTNLKEWFPFNAEGDRAGPRRHVRPLHPYSSMREAGSKKRRRVSLGAQEWTVGDHVDAFIQDGWWEGVVVELNDLDDTKATIYFPGENDTQVVKMWDLRPSLHWEDGKWVPWMDSAVTEDERPRKMGGSTSKTKKDKQEKGSVQEGSKVTRASRTPTNELKQDTSTAKVSQKKSPKKTACSKGSDVKDMKTASGSHQKVGGTPGTPKKLDCEVAPEVTAPKTRASLKAERQEQKRPTRQSPKAKVGTTTN